MVVRLPSWFSVHSSSSTRPWPPSWRKAEILPYLVRLRDQSAVPMIYVSHSADEVRMLATQVLQLQQGRIVARGGIEVLRTAGI